MDAADRDADNTSPDSGLDLDVKSSEGLLDPSRRLTLLKSLSQDSEYSLDTSLFDAEEFLQDMGFAGTCDPTIPDRFLPSLMQRLSRFPEAEMESLHDRIIQSIGCFRRKEGKRRLFRNLSMGKNFSRHFLGFPSNGSYPLLRSNTDPTTFPYEETSSASDSLQSDRLSSNSSRLHSLGSSKEEGEFPESPIAILVSAASVDQENYSQLQTAAEKKTSLADVALQEDSSKSEFVSTVEEIQKLTHKISNQESHGDGNASHDGDGNASHDLNGDVSHDLGIVSQSGIESESEELSTGLDQEVVLEDTYCPSEAKNRMLSETHNPFMESANSESGSIHDYSSLKYIHASKSDESLSHISTNNHDFLELQSLEKNGKSLSAKPPLRRISSARFSIPKSFRNSARSELTDVDGLSNAVSGTYEDETSQYPHRNETGREKVETIENSLICVTSANSDVSLNDVPEHECSISSYLPFQNVPQTNSNNFFKPKYSRDDSLTNFLSSMLDTSDNSSERPSVGPMNPVLENSCNSDSEIPGSFASSPFISPFAADAKSTSQSNKIPRRKISTVFTPDKNSKATDKAPNRKRRVLRRMSSSLQYCDDVNCSDSRDLKMDSFDSNTPRNISSPEMYRNPNTPHEGLKSASSCHQVIHPCNSMPAINFCRHCSLHYAEEGIGCPEQISRNCDCSMDCGRKSSCFRKCKRRRNLSCPSPGVSLNYCGWIQPKAEMQTMPAARCDCETSKCQQVFNKRNRHRSLINTCNWTEDTSWTDACCSEYCNCNINERCAAPRTNIFYSTSSENLASNIGYFGPLSPLPQPKNNPFTFESNLRNQTRHFCYSNPELRHECCFVPPNHCEIHCKQRLISDLDEFNLNPFPKNEKFIEEQKPKTSCRQENQSFEGAFIPDPNQYKEYPGVKQNRVSVRTPQRQHSISVADSEVQTQGWSIDGSVFPFFQQSSCTVPFNRDPVEGKILPPPTAMSLSKDNRNDYFPSTNVPKASQNHDVLHNVSIANGKQSPTVDASVIKAEDAKEVAQTSSTNNKSEALLERKIRIFSKFLVNLGNLSKSISDTDADNKHKSTRDPDATTSYDKRTKSRVSKVSCPAARKRSNTSPEFGKLLNLLKSMDCGNGDPKNGFVPSPGKTEFPEVCEMKLQKNDSPVYENKVLLRTCIDENQQRFFKPVLYNSSVSLYINGEAKKDILINRSENSHSSSSESRVREINSSAKDSRNSSSQMSFKGVSKEIEGLQLSIQKAKETRICASKELQLLQKLLSVDDENHEKEKRLSVADSKRCASSRTTPDVHATRALTNLRENSKKEILEDTAFWKEEIDKVKEETRQEWQAKLDRMEARLCSQEEELRRLQGDNETLRRESPVCHQCRSEGGQNGRTDSAFEDDEEYHKPPSIPIQSTRQECDRLQERLLEEEQRADQLNLMLNQKLIELNKIQITLSKQTKEMIELEKSYLQLQCRLRKGTSKPIVSRICSRSSPFSSKNLYPKPSPPASPNPTHDAS